jgi:HSP20 family protein
MKMIPWDPFRELDSLSQRLGQYLAQPAGKSPGSDAVFADWAPAVDIVETDGAYLMKADLPDVKKEDVKVAIADGVLSLEGERRLDKEEKGKTFHRVERMYGKFVRRLAVPTDVDQQKVAAEFKDGVLNVHLPKSASAKPKTVDVKVA